MKSAVNLSTIQRITLSASVTTVAGRSLSGISWAGLPRSTARNSGRQETGSGRSTASCLVQFADPVIKGSGIDSLILTPLVIGKKVEQNARVSWQLLYMFLTINMEDLEKFTINNLYEDS